MSFDSSAVGALGGAPRQTAIRPGIAARRVFIIAAGISAAMLFVVVGLVNQFQMYADGSIFSYAVAAQDAWAFHWHNISGRLFVYLFCHVPAQLYVGLTGDARGGIDVYGFLFFGAQALGLVLTYFADRSNRRIIFCTACLSVACLCPLVFGYPTEMWLSHALFWPALAVCHYARPTVGGFFAVAAALFALVFTHEAAVVFAAAIMATLLLRGLDDAALRRAAGVLVGVMTVWALVKASLPPDANFASILMNVAMNSIDLTSLTCGLFKLLASTLVSYGVVYLVLRQVAPASAHVLATLVVAALLGGYWLWFDHSLHTDNRYYLRTALLIGTPMLGALAAFRALDAEGRIALPLPFLPFIRAILARGAIGPLAGGVLLVLLVHGVETAKFVAEWGRYKSAVQALAMGTQNDPALGDPHFVAATRIAGALDRMSWPSTTPYLSVLVAPAFAPKMLVVDPRANYFWISCETAEANASAERALPAQSRRLIQTHACVQR